MAHELLRLSCSVWNTPHLITPSALEPILNYLEFRNETGGLQMSSVISTTELDDPKPYSGTIGVLRVDGSLTYKPVMTMCGSAGTSYKQLVSQVEEMAEAGVKTIVMEVSSGGGEAGHCFETAAAIRELADDNGIRLIGYADTHAASAAYALICMCDEVIANPSASLGSIGCVVALMDQSKALEKAGLKRIFVTSGKSKVPFAEDGSFKQEFLDEIQKSVDKLNVEFAAHVSKYTGLDMDAIMDLEAKVFDANEAVELGLANKVMTQKQFLAYVAELHKGAA